jgi:hypothetical protein
VHCSGRPLTLAVVAEGHFRLAEANRVLSLGDAIELFELRLGDALDIELETSLQGVQCPRKVQVARFLLCTCLAGEIELNGFDADVLRSSSHDCSVL